MPWAGQASQGVVHGGFRGSAHSRALGKRGADSGRAVVLRLGWLANLQPDTRRRTLTKASIAPPKRT
jgi:hypothetical protein